MNNWYAQKGSSGQGLVADEVTGKTIAVTYDKKDAKPISLTPRMINVINKALKELDYLRRETSIRTCAGGDFIEVDDTIIRELRAIKSELGSE